jgi:hypothetical protein
MYVALKSNKQKNFQLVRGTDPRIRIRTKMSRIRITGCNIKRITLALQWAN